MHAYDPRADSSPSGRRRRRCGSVRARSHSRGCHMAPIPLRGCTRVGLLPPPPLVKPEGDQFGQPQRCIEVHRQQTAHRVGEHCGRGTDRSLDPGRADRRVNPTHPRDGSIGKHPATVIAGKVGLRWPALSRWCRRSCGAPSPRCRRRTCRGCFARHSLWPRFRADRRYKRSRSRCLRGAREYRYDASGSLDIVEKLGRKSCQTPRFKTCGGGFGKAHRHHPSSTGNLSGLLTAAACRRRCGCHFCLTGTALLPKS